MTPAVVVESRFTVRRRGEPLKTTVSRLLVCIALFASQVGSAQAPQQRQFDFWVGAWDVNLRVRHNDGTWHDDIQAREYSYPLLDGKAIMELWSETSRVNGRQGYSIRYYRGDLDQWELWLNWPEPNQSGSSYLRGQFRHNRGEFFSDSKQNDSTTVTARYTFSDITPTSFRWDDAFTADHGATWRNAWIMEFTRTAALPPALSPGAPSNIYGTGTLCAGAQFREFEKLSGVFAGTMRYRADTAGPWKSSAATLTTYRIIGGCATISFLEYSKAGATYKRFSHNTCNTTMHAFEVGALDNVPGTIYQSSFGQKTGSRFELSGMDVPTAAATDRRSIWTIENSRFTLDEFTRVGRDWFAVAQGTFTAVK